MVNIMPSQPCNPQRLNKTKLLIGEGKDEQRLFTALLKVLNLSESIQVEYYEGKDNLSRYLKGLSIRPAYQCLESLGIFRDADTDAKSAFQSVQDALSKAKLTCPSQSGQFTEEKPRVGIFILPDGVNNGMLEDVCLAAVKSSPEMKCVDQYFQCLTDTVPRQLKNISKAKVHAWLSSQNEPDKRLAEAAEAGYWPWESPVFDLLKQFLIEL